MEIVELFSQEWCEAAKKVWADIVYDLIVDKEAYNYSARWGVTDRPEQVCTFLAEKGHLEYWDAGSPIPADQLTFDIWAKLEHWQKVAEGTLDPVGAVAAKRIHLRKGPMTVVINETVAFTRLLKEYGSIPTKW